MIDKDFDQLSFGEKWTLQKMMKKKRKGISLTDNEQGLFDRFSDEYVAAEKMSKSRWPIILFLIISGLFALMRQ